MDPVAPAPIDPAPAGSPPAPASAGAGGNAPAEAAARPRRSRGWVWALRALLFAPLVAALGAAAALTWALHADTGTAWLLVRLPPLPGVGRLQVEAPQGALLGPRFGAGRVSLRLEAVGLELDVEGLQWEGAQWRWWLGDGVWAGLEAARVQAGAVRVQWRADPARALQAPATLRLPLHLRADTFAVGTLSLQGIAIRSLAGSGLQLGADDGASHRIEQLQLAWDRLQARGQARIGVDPPFALQARVDAQGSGEPAWSAALQAEGPLQAPRVRGSLQAGIGAAAPALDIAAELRPFAAWPLGPLDLDLRALDLAPLATGLPATRLTGHARITTTGTQAPLQATLELDNAAPGRWDQGRLPLRRLRAGLSADPALTEQVQMQGLEIELADERRSAGKARGSGRWDAQGLRLALVLDALRPALADARGPGMTLSGPLQASVSGLALPGANPPALATGAAVQRALEVQATLDGLLEALNRPLSLALDITAQPDRIELRRFQAASGPARATMGGSAARQADGAWQVRSQGQVADFDPAPWLPAASAAWRRGPHRLNAAWTLDLGLPLNAASRPALQVLPTLQGSGRLELANSVLAGVAVQGRAEIGQAPSGPGRSQARGDFVAGGNRLVFEGQADPSGTGQADRWRLDWTAPALATLAPLAALDPALARWLPTAGDSRGRALAQGRWPALRTEGDLQLRALRAGPWTVGQGQAAWKLDTTGQQPMQLRLELADAAYDEGRIARLRVEAQGTLQEHHAQLEVAAPLQPPPLLAATLGLPAGEGAQARLSLRGRWARASTGGGRWAGAVDRLEAGPWQAVTAAPGVAMPASAGWLEALGLATELDFDADGRLAAAQVQPGRARLAGGLDLRWKEAHYRAAGPAGARDDVELQAEIAPFAAQPVLQRLLPALQWSGDLRAGARLQLRAADTVQADLRLQRLDGDLIVGDGDARFPLGVSELDLALLARDGRWTLTPLMVGRTLGTVSGALTVTPPPGQRWPDMQSPLDGAVLFRVPSLGIWSGWIPAGWRVDGAVETLARLGGRLGAPELTGELRAEGLGVRNLLQGVDYGDGELVIALQGSTARIERLSLRGGDGTLSGSGSAQLGASPQARLELQAEGFRMLGRIDRQLVASGRATLALRPDRVQLQGRVGVDSGLFDLATRDAPTLDADVHVRRPGTAGPGEGAEASTPTPVMRQAAVQLDVDLGQRLRVRGRGLDTMLQGELRVSTPQGRLNVEGNVRANGGTYVAYGQKLRIERGIVAFTGRVDTPRLDILALRPNIDQPVGVAISGSPQAPRVRLYSEPELPESEKLSWLVLGRGTEGLGRADAAVLQRAAVALLAGENEAPTDRLLRTFGIDDLSLRQGDGELRETVVTLGKQLSRNWYLGYERSVNATAGTWQLVYRIAQRFTLRAQSGLENSLDLIFTWRFDRPPVAKSPPAPPP
jgi:translocation and assembly module TamB